MNPPTTKTPAAPVHLNRYHHFTQLMRDPSIEGVLSRYSSPFDQSPQSLLVLRPRKKSPGPLFVFFHGMDGDCGDAVVARQLVSSLGGTVAAPGGRGPAWVSDAFLVDAGQIIRRYARDHDKVYLIGISMGGTQALALAPGVAGMLGPKLAGVLAFIPGADLVDAAQSSVNSRVRDSMIASVEGDLGKLRERSPLAMIEQYPPGLPFAVAYNQADTILPVRSILAFIDGLRGRGLPVVAYSIPGDHSFVTDQLDERLDYQQVLSDLGKTSSTTVQVPTLQPAARAA